MLNLLIYRLCEELFFPPIDAELFHDYFSFFFFFFNLFIFERQRDRAEVGEGQRERESEAGSSLPAASTEPDKGLQLMNCEIMN